MYLVIQVEWIWIIHIHMDMDMDYPSPLASLPGIFNPLTNMNYICFLIVIKSVQLAGKDLE
jgi:hypothetical protein